MEDISLRQDGPRDGLYGGMDREALAADRRILSREPPRSCWASVMALFDVELGLQIFPMALVILFPLTFLTSYLIAVLLGHVEPGFPYISDTGTRPPESCIFGQFLNVCSVLGGVCIYIKYRHFREFCQFGDVVAVRLNKACLALGLLACIGVSMVANFQETSVLAVHMVGANLAFGIGTVYCWVMWVASFRYRGSMNSACLAHFRLAISVLATIAFILVFPFGVLAANKFHGKDKRRWNPDDGGFAFHVVSTASEWVLAGCILLYFGSLIPDFKRVGGRAPEIFLVVDEEEADLLPRADVVA